MKTTSEKFEFENSEGELLAGRIELPESPMAFAIFAHCFTCSKNVRAASRISRALAEQGIAVLRFDFTGLGNSEGDFSNTNFSSNVDDLVSAAAQITKSFQAPSLLVGHSFGGTAALIAASRIDSVKAVATIGSPADPEHVTHLFGDNIDEIDENGKHRVVLAGRPFTIRKQFVDDVRNTEADETVKRLDCAVMIYHSPQDELVNIEQARITYDRLRHPKNFISLDGADHMLTSEDDSEFVAKTLAAWAERYLEFSPTRPSDSEKGESVPDGGVVSVQETNGFAQIVRTNQHEIHADEPAGVGGTNTGMTPYDLLLASLGSCTSMTIRMYANHKKWKVDSIEVRLQHSRVHSQDCEDCESPSSKISLIEKEIVVAGDLDDKQLTRLKEIGERCPVHRTLMEEKKIESTIRRLS